MNARAASRYLHVSSGTSTTRVIQEAGIPGEVSIWADPLYEGPVPAGLDDAGLLEARARYLSGDAREEDADPTNDLRRWRSAIERIDAYDEVILWFEHDLFDQLNLVQLLAWIREHGAPRPVSLVCIGSFPGRPHFKGLGELTPRELAPLLETRQPVGAGHYAAAARAWQAFRDPAPGALDAFRRGDTAVLPYLAPAITRFLQEYPWTSDGLSRTERRLLELAHAGRIDLRAAFPRMHEAEDRYYITDLSLATLAVSLAQATPPLLTLGNPGRADGGLQGTVETTDAGRAVLAGRSDRVLLCGVDRWLGGVHLEGRGETWRWDEANQRIARA